MAPDDGMTHRPGDAQRSGEPAVLVVEDLRAGYGERVVLEGVSFAVGASQRVAVVGPNGAGKSTLFKCIAGVLRPLSGRITLEPVAERTAGGRAVWGNAVAYAPQREEVNWHFPATVWDVVMMGRYRHIGAWRRPRPADREAVAEGLRQVGMLEWARAPIQALSGGQQQRVFLARALAQEASLVLLDEPFNAVEPAAQAAVVEALSALEAKGVALLVSTHDLDFVAGSQWFDRVMVLHGRILAFGPPEQVWGRREVAGQHSAVRWAEPGRWSAWGRLEGVDGDRGETQDVRGMVWRGGER